MWYKVYIVCSELINDSDTAYGLYVASISLIIVAQSFMTCCLIVADLWSSHWCGKFTVKWETFSCELVLVSQMVYAKSPACRNRQLPHLQLIFFFFFTDLHFLSTGLITYKLTDGEKQRMKLIMVRVISSIFGSISGEAI